MTLHAATRDSVLDPSDHDIPYTEIGILKSLYVVWEMCVSEGESEDRGTSLEEWREPSKEGYFHEEYR